MPSKDCFQVGTKLLKHANYYLPLNEDCYIAAYQERVLLGHVEDFEQDMQYLETDAQEGLDLMIREVLPKVMDIGWIGGTRWKENEEWQKVPWSTQILLGCVYPIRGTLIDTHEVPP